MRITHLHTGADARSHFEDVELDLAPREDGVGIEFSEAVQGVALRSVPISSSEYHTAPRRQLVIQLTGSGEIVCGDGTTRTFGPGDVLLVDDRTGQGHISREISGPRTQAVIYLDPNFDLQTLFAGP